MPTVPNVGAKGDIVIGSPNLTWRTLGVGADDYVPVAYAGGTLGIVWVHPSTLKHIGAAGVKAVLDQDETLPANCQKIVHKKYTMEPGNTLTIEPGAKVVILSG